MGTSGSVRSGTLRGQTIRDILSGTATQGESIPDTIYVYANNQDRVSQFRIHMDGATSEERRAFMSLLSGRSNTGDRNAERSYLTAMRDARETVQGISDADARAAAEIVRSNTTFNAINNLLNRDRSGANRFPNISISRPNRRRR